MSKLKRSISVYTGQWKKDMCSMFFISIALFSTMKPCSSDVLVMKRGYNRSIEIFDDLPANFGAVLPLAGLKGYVVNVFPSHACIPPSRPPNLPSYNGRFIALVRRYNCTFVEKVLNAQISGYDGVIVRNVGSNDLETMDGGEESTSIIIPSVFIGQDDGLRIESHFLYNTGYFVVITGDFPINIQNYLIPFAITIGICFVFMLSLMLVKCIRDYRRTRRCRLSSRALKKLPIHKFKKGDPYDCCAVCLEDYVDNEKLRILPCSHAYHSKCIDPWLTKNRRVCPVCKRKVITGDERASDFESDSEDETAPLINSEGGTQGGTFAPQRENPFQEAARMRQEESERSRNGYGRLPEVEEEEETDDDMGTRPLNPSLRDSHLSSSDSSSGSEGNGFSGIEATTEEGAAAADLGEPTFIRQEDPEVSVEGTAPGASRDCLV